jgi:hypothetical protein
VSDLVFPASSLVKLALQVLAAHGAFACARAFTHADRTRRSWTWLGVAMSLFAGGQLVLAWWHVVQRTQAPFPSPADALFVPATIVLALALADFAAAYSRPELGLGSRREAVRTAGVTALVLGAAIAMLLSKVLASEAPLGERLLAATYPSLDLALLVPTAVVLRQTWHLRGGSLWRCWVRLLGGAVCLAAGDVAFAYFTTLGIAALDPVLDATFICGYWLIASGTRNQVANATVKV